MARLKSADQHKTVINAAYGWLGIPLTCRWCGYKLAEFKLKDDLEIIGSAGVALYGEPVSPKATEPKPMSASTMATHILSDGRSPLPKYKVGGSLVSWHKKNKEFSRGYGLPILFSKRVCTSKDIASHRALHTAIKAESTALNLERLRGDNTFCHMGCAIQFARAVAMNGIIPPAIDKKQQKINRTSLKVFRHVYPYYQPKCANMGFLKGEVQ